MITLTLAFVVRPSPLATDKCLITRINWPDCNCRCACYRHSHRDAPVPAHERNSLSTAENAELGASEQRGERGCERRGCAIIRTRHCATQLYQRGPWESRSVRGYRQLRGIQEIVVMTRPICQIFSWLMTQKRFCSSPPCELLSDRTN